MADDYSDYTVSSEVNTFIAENNDSQESSRSDAVIVSRFTFSYPKGLKSVSVDLVSYAGSKYDEDGDLITSCSSDAAEQCQEDTLHIEHRMSTSLDMVGLQVWRGAFLLADYILHNYQLLQGQTIIELGSGTGLSGIVASMVAEKVVCTDIDMGDILPLIRRNVDRNKRLLKNDVVVEELDFCKPFTSSMESHLIQATFVIVCFHNNGFGFGSAVLRVFSHRVLVDAFCVILDHFRSKLLPVNFQTVNVGLFLRIAFTGKSPIISPIFERQFRRQSREYYEVISDLRTFILDIITLFRSDSTKYLLTFRMKKSWRITYPF
nr:EOG090X0C5G [Lepidurus arcticus]